VKRLTTSILALSLFLLCACGGSENSSTQTSTSSSLASSSSQPAHQYLGTIEASAVITSQITGITYPYHVYLPHKYAQSDEQYAIVYGTDAQWVFPYFSRVIDARNKPVIFVGIEEGPPGSDRRSTDYTPPGALAYIEFLKTEFIPMIEAKYRTNGERTYVGASYGGLLGAILLSKENVGAPYFKNYLLFDGAFWAYTANFIQDEEKRFAADKKLPINLILTSANPGNYREVDSYEKRYRDRQYEDINIYRKSFDIEHRDVGNPSFDYAIDMVY
jgi:predicted alpha/beta superfamily hydrolase